MDSVATSAQGKLKEVLRTALIGIQPGDQVMLKGYLRVLLRLEVDLEWVAATSHNVDLFLINSQFQSADSVINLLESNAAVPVLYVTRSLNAEGEFNGNTITLPLKKLHDLNYWLFKNIAVLHNNNAKYRQVINDSELTIKNSPPSTMVSDVKPATLTSKNLTSQPKNLSNKIDQANHQGDLLLNFVKKLKLREDKFYELWVKSEFVGILHSKRQCIWLTNEAADELFAPDSTWELRETSKKPKDTNKHEDLAYWLWIQAYYQPKAILPLVSSMQQYRLRFWIKPPNDNSRREIIRIFTAIEGQSRTVVDIAETVDATKEMVSKTIIGLLFSGNLMPDIYKALEADIESYDKVIESEVNHDVNSAIDISRSRSIDDILARRQAGEAPVVISSSVDLSQLSKQANTKASLDNGSTVKTQSAQPSQHSQTAKDETQSGVQSKKRGFLSRLRAKLGL